MALLLLLLLVASPRTVDLTPRWAAPEQTTVILEVERRFATAGDALKSTAATVEKLDLVYGEKVKKLAGGRPALLQRKYARYRLVTEAWFGGEKMGSETEHHRVTGTVATFFRKGGALVPVRPLPRGKDQKAPIAGVDWFRLLPGKTVAVGDSWSPGTLATLDSLAGTECGRVECTLEYFDQSKKEAGILVRAGRLRGRATWSAKSGKIVNVELEGKVRSRETEGVVREVDVRIRCRRRVSARR